VRAARAGDACTHDRRLAGAHFLTAIPSYKAIGTLTGSVRNERSEQLQPVECSLGEVTRMMSNWGVGARDLMARHGKQPAAPQPG
jgi:hypothetical protein